ncbi:MAG: hypothetical protein LBD04_07190 [Synergistaceae bacterium]|jgi:phage protein D|nr:hypothetical protein [Synergistaceae bacterium]
MAKLKRGAVQGSLTVPCYAALVAGAEITLSGFKPEGIDEAYLGKKVQRSMSKSGWTTQVSLEWL